MTAKCMAKLPANALQQARIYARQFLGGLQQVGKVLWPKAEPTLDPPLDYMQKALDSLLRTTARSKFFGQPGSCMKHLCSILSS
mmetsp:Transcript_74955/g.145039  ORF Transcript_74955/g.145039 Transcript_74955/m.145039 type:complete len:84 (+) Transcript_74955:130-381(+)